MNQFNTVWLPLLYNCNNKCRWCYAPSEKIVSSDKILNDKKEKDFVGLISDLGVKKVIFIGGEPSIYPNLERVIGRVYEKGISPAIVTNGRKFSDKNFIKKLMDAGLRSATISIEGSNSEIHDYTTQVKGSFYQAIQGLENALELGLPLSTETTMSKDNKDDLENMVEFLENYDLSHRLFNICGPCLSDLTNSNYILTLSEGSKLFEKVYKKAKKKNLRLVTPVPICNFDQDIYKEMVNNKAISHGCHLLFGFNFVLDPNGDILPCVHFSNFPIFNVYENGKIIKTEEFLERYNNPDNTNQLFRNELKRYPSEKCLEGECWNPCTGGCSIFWLRDNPKVEIKGIKLTQNA